MVLAFFAFFYYDTCTWIILIRNALMFSSSVSDEIHRRKGCVRPGTEGNCIWKKCMKC